MSTIDVLIITALKEEYDAARGVALATRKVSVGIAKWEERDATTPTPYLLGRYVAAGGLSMNVALARPTRMGGTATSIVAASLVERLKPHCLAMCGVCAGNPGDVALGDVIIAEMVYPYDEGKQKQDVFEGDHRQTPMLDTWVRAAQDLVPDGLPSFGAASDKEAQSWLLERLYAGDNPRTHPARSRYFPGNTWEERVRAFESGGLVRREGLQLVLTDSGRSFVEETLFYDVEGPRRLPFQIKVGPIASGNVVVKDGITWEKLKKWGVRSVLGLEMEAATIGSTAHRIGVPVWVVAKGVMDHADPRKDDRYKRFAARSSSEVLFKFLSNQIPAMSSERREEQTALVKSVDGTGCMTAASPEQPHLALWPINGEGRNVITGGSNLKQGGSGRFYISLQFAIRSNVRQTIRTLKVEYFKGRSDIPCGHVAHHGMIDDKEWVFSLDSNLEPPLECEPLQLHTFYYCAELFGHDSPYGPEGTDYGRGRLRIGATDSELETYFYLNPLGKMLLSEDSWIGPEAYYDKS